MKEKTPGSDPHPWELAWKEERWQELSPPLPAVVEFADYLRKNQACRVLDLGCGAGRHTIVLASAGFQVTSLDVSGTALKELEARIDKSKLTNITLVKHDMIELPFVDGYFDGVVCTNVLHHGTMHDIRKTIMELYRVSKTGSHSLIVTLSKNDFRFGMGDNLEPDTYRFTDGDEKGITHHFFLESQLRSVFSDFEIEDLREELIPVEHGKRAHFLVRISKA